MKLTLRQNAIVSEIDRCGVVADIGCDHGQITLGIVLRDLCDKIIATDISPGSLEKTKRLFEEYGLLHKAEFRVCDGLDFETPVDVCIIAGMGGLNISGILNRARALPQKLVLQPMRDTQTVRDTLLTLSYKITRDFTVIDKGRKYDIITGIREKGIGNRKRTAPQTIPFSLTSVP